MQSCRHASRPSLRVTFGQADDQGTRSLSLGARDILLFGITVTAASASVTVPARLHLRSWAAACLLLVLLLFFLRLLLRFLAILALLWLLALLVLLLTALTQDRLSPLGLSCAMQARQVLRANLSCLCAGTSELQSEPRALLLSEQPVLERGPMDSLACNIAKLSSSGTSKHAGQ